MSQFPLAYIKEIRDVLIIDLHDRLQPDVFQGILLEIVSVISKDICDLYQGETTSLVLGHKHITYLIDQFMQSGQHKLVIVDS